MNGLSDHFPRHATEPTLAGLRNDCTGQYVPFADILPHLCGVRNFDHLRRRSNVGQHLADPGHATGFGRPDGAADSLGAVGALVCDSLCLRGSPLHGVRARPQRSRCRVS